MKNNNKILIWDLSLRIYHFFLIILVLGLILSAKLDRLGIHQYLGVAILGLLIFRLVWGFIGSYTSKFKSFTLSAYKLYSFFSGECKSKSVRSPTASLSVVTFMITLFLLTISGLFSSDDVLYDAPLSFLLPEYINFFTKVHNISHYVLYVILSLHLTAIFYYQFFKKNKIIQQFIDGYARDDEVENKPIIQNSMKGIYLLLILIFLPVILLWYL